MNNVHRLVIIGGGASGLELATKLRNKFHNKNFPFGKLHITLVDKNRTHIWKPKLHEVASGSMDMGDHELNYHAQAHWHHFSFRLGAMKGLDREKKLIHLAEYRDDEGN
jgi:NADH dehydrogenase